MKQFFNRIFICLVPVLISAAVVGWAAHRHNQGRGGFRLGVDLVGGTILIYEVDPTKKSTDPTNKGDVESLAASLKKRIDPADLYSVTIRDIAGDPPRVEIILPTGGRRQAQARENAWKDLVRTVAAKYPPIDKDGKEGTYDTVPVGQINTLIRDAAKFNGEDNFKAIDQFVRERAHASTEKRSLDEEGIQNIKNLITQQGRLEFRILANPNDDREAIETTEKWLTDPANANELKQLELRGEPPPPPVSASGPTFPVQLGGDTSRHAYSWVEVGKEELYSLHLNNKALEGDPINNKDVIEARGKRPVTRTQQSRDGFTQYVLYSREITNPDRISSREREQGKKYEYFLLTRESEPGKEVTGDHLSSAKAGFDHRGSGLAVHFTFSAEGGNRFFDLTSHNKPQKEGGLKRNLAVILDGQVRSAPALFEPIRTNGQISGDFTQKEIENLVTILRAGALPATLKSLPVSERTMGATLGDDTIKSGTESVFWAFLAVMGFMVIYYRFAGLVACVALMANLLMTVAFMVMVNATFTLPGLAGLVLTLGMAVDANVLIYERLREERERGASLALALRNGYDRAFPTIIDTHLSSIFTAIVLYVVGNDQLKGFGISLTVGLVISLFTSLYMTRTLFDIWQHKGWLTKLSMMQLFRRPNIDFMGIRYYWFTATIILTIIGAGLFLHRGSAGLNIDFVGGTSYSGQLTKTMTIQELRKALDGVHLPELSIESVFINDPDFSQGDASKLFTVRTTEKDAKAVMAAINDKLKGDLRSIKLEDPQIDSSGKKVTLVFYVEDPQTKEKKPDYASKALVTRILTEKFKEHGLESAIKRMRINPAEGAEQKEGRLTKMQLDLAESDQVDVAKLKTALAATQKEFGAQPQPEGLENFDSQLAASTRERAMYAIIASWAAILLYLWFRFGNWTFGAAAVLCLIHDLFFTLGAIAGAYYIHEYVPGLASFLKIQDFKIDLPAVAALLTLVGYSVNDTIVVFDRIREVRGKAPHLTADMINDSVNQTLSRTVLASLTVWLVVIVLYWFGGDGVHLFAYVMVVGVIVGTYSSIYIASPLLLIFGEGGKAPIVDSARTVQPVGAQ